MISVISEGGSEASAAFQEDSRKQQLKWTPAYLGKDCRTWTSTKINCDKCPLSRECVMSQLRIRDWSEALNIPMLKYWLIFL